VLRWTASDLDSELLSEQQLSALLPPTLRYLLVVATQRQPRYLLRILNSWDELYALLMLAVERHYLVTYGGGFTENFYGLKRERVLRIKGGEAPRAQIAAPELMRETLKLTNSDVWKNLAVMVGIPYLKRKLDEAYEVHAPQALLLGPNFNRDTLPPDATLRQRIVYYYKWFLRNVYPSLNAAYHFSILAFQLAYLSSNTTCSSPFLWLMQCRIRRLGEADYRAIALAAEPKTTPARPGQQNSIFNPRTFNTILLPRLLSSLRFLLPTSIFALKFLEWWHASDFARQLSRKATEGLELPPPIISGLPPPQQAESKSSTSLGVKPSPTPSSSPPRTSSVSLANRPPSPPPPKPASLDPDSLPSKPSSPAGRRIHSSPPISSITSLPILTVQAPTTMTSALCPICLGPIVTPTACQTGYVFCYTCVFRWVDGSHDRQERWMRGEGGEEGWGEEEEEDALAEMEGRSREDRYDGGERGGWGDGGTTAGNGTGNGNARKGRSRVGRWEDGKGRCAVTGRRVLGGTEGLRRVMV